MREPAASLGGLHARGLVEVSHDLGVLDDAGRWAVALPYAGPPVLARFAEWTREAPDPEPAGWRGPARGDWASSLDEAGYVAAVETVRGLIAVGDVYQANVCRVLSAPLPDRERADVAALATLLADGNPAPYGGFLRLPDHGVHIASASPELFLSVRAHGRRRVAVSGPIKGTGRTAEDLSDKDAAENVMIVDLVRNDLSVVSEPGGVSVPSLLEVQEHPGLVHLVSYVEGVLRRHVTWTELLAATFPPGSVTGAPKRAALRIIGEVERSSREYYCGALGWVDADAGTAELAVTIRTFWHDGMTLRFGTGAGITWGSDAAAEWQETCLKADRLVGIAAGRWPEDVRGAWQAGSP